MFSEPNRPPLLELRRITKSFHTVPVLHDVDFDVCAGEVHALVGENGAGKSTLMNIVGGVHAADAGEMLWEGRRVAAATPRQSQELGISFVHQELALAPQLSVAENIFLGSHPVARLRCWVRWGEMEERARSLLAELGQTIDPAQPVESLSLAERQLVEIAKALAARARLIIMDEPTAPLSEKETARLFSVIAQLRGRGVAVIYISHRLMEIFQVAGRVTVLRDGRRIMTRPVADTSHGELVSAMVGAEIEDRHPPSASPPAAAEALRIEGWSAPGSFRDIHLTLRRGEIVGLAGLAGAGRTELLESLFGVGERDAGRLYVNGRPVALRTPEDAVRHGLALVPDDRKAKGLVLTGSLLFNLVLAAPRAHARAGLFPNGGAEKRAGERLVEALRIKAAGMQQLVQHLSGGNQQKVVLGKWLFAGASVFLLDEPTRGVDVRAKAEIYEIIRGLAARGAAVLFVSSELEEILRLADRVLVMHRGRVTGELAGAQATQERIMQLATGGEN